MIRLTVVVEGDSEEALVSRILAPHLHAFDVFTKAMIVRTRMARAGTRAAHGGGRWAQMKNDILRVLASDQGADLRVSTMVDLYRVPSDYPGLAHALTTPDRSARCARIEGAMREELADARFIPYIQKHEFESLVFCGLAELTRLVDSQRERDAVGHLLAEVAGVPPEDVDDGEESAPSKRLQSALSGYKKLVHGPLVLESTGLAAIRASCPRFNGWVTRLERLNTVPIHQPL